MKTTYIALGVIIFGLSTLGALVIHNKKQSAVPLCPVDVMMCPDGSSIPRAGKDCEFGVCKEIRKVQEEKVSASTPLPVPEETATTSLSSGETKKPTAPPNKKVSILSKILTAAKTTATETSNFIQGAVSSGVSETKQAVSNQNNQVKNLTTIPEYTPSSVTTSTTISEVRYDVVNNTIFGNNNTVIYTLPPTSGTSSEALGWETHTVNVVPVNTVAPIVGAIPVTGLPGKYYLSVNSFGNVENCEFSNKIYILDTNTGERVLMYEENNQTLLNDDPRACNSEMYLLATDEEKLILKYHTIGTNMTCESTWSEPEKTWYLDVTKLTEKTRRYIISTPLYTQAEEEETTCRSGLQQP